MVTASSVMMRLKETFADLDSGVGEKFVLPRNEETSGS